MARDKKTPATMEPADEFSQFEQDLDAEAEAPAADEMDFAAEREQIRAERAALELEKAALKAEREQIRAERAPPADYGVLPAGEPDPAWPTFLVRVKEAPAWVVRAPHAGLAFEAYRRATGLIATPYVPEVSPTDLPVGRHMG